MNDQQRLRYSRHILLNEIGIEGQELLLGGHALILDNVPDMNVMRGNLGKYPACCVCGENASRVSTKYPEGDAATARCRNGLCPG